MRWLFARALYHVVYAGSIMVMATLTRAGKSYALLIGVVLLLTVGLVLYSQVFAFVWDEGHHVLAASGVALDAAYRASEKSPVALLRLLWITWTAGTTGLHVRLRPIPLPIRPMAIGGAGASIDAGGNQGCAGRE